MVYRLDDRKYVLYAMRFAKNNHIVRQTLYRITLELADNVYIVCKQVSSLHTENQAIYIMIYVAELKYAWYCNK